MQFPEAVHTLMPVQSGSTPYQALLNMEAIVPSYQAVLIDTIQIRVVESGVRMSFLLDMDSGSMKPPVRVVPSVMIHR